MESLLENPVIGEKLKKASQEISQWLERLAQMRVLTQESHDGNPVQLLAVRMYEELASGKLHHQKLQKLIHALADEAFVHRAGQLRKFTAAHKFEENQNRCKAVFFRNCAPI